MKCKPGVININYGNQCQLNDWNSLSQEVVQAKTVNEFKTKIDYM